jgi:hypothetical protein
MNNDLIMKAITLSGEERKVTSQGSTIVKVKDEKGLTYSFFMKKQDGSESKAYEGYKKFQLGDTVEIHYSEQQRTTQDGKPYTARGIAFFGEKVSPSAQPQNAAPRGLQSVKDNSIIRQVAFKGAVEMAVAGKIDLVAIEKYTNSFERIIQGYPSSQSVENASPEASQSVTEPPTDDLPVINQDEDINVEDIPF